MAATPSTLQNESEWSGTSVFVTGGTGFLGHVLVRHLLARGAHVCVYDHTTRARHYPDNPGSVTLVTGDLLDGDRLAEVLADVAPAYILHLAAIHYIPYCNAHPDETLMVNVVGTQRLLSAMQALPTAPQAFMFVSTAAVYPPSDTPHSEECTPHPMDIYGISKLAGEKLAELYHRATTVPVRIPRLFNLYGPGETSPHLLSTILTQLRNGDTVSLGNLTPRRDFVFIDDVARALLALLETADAGCTTVNVGTGHTHSVQDVIDLCEDVLGRPLTVSVDDTRVRPVDRPVLCADVSRLKQLTGWEPRVSFRNGLAHLLAEEGLHA